MKILIVDDYYIGFSFFNRFTGIRKARLIFIVTFSYGFSKSRNATFKTDELVDGVLSQN